MLRAGPTCSWLGQGYTRRRILCQPSLFSGSGAEAARRGLRDVGTQAAMRDAYGEALLELGASNPRVVVVGADTTGSLKSGVFATKFPARFFNVGIAEQNLIGIAAGLAHAGKITYAGTYAIFVPGKCVDQIRNNVAYPNLDVKIVCSHGGVTVGPDGASHQQVEDIAIMRAIPRMRVDRPSRLGLDQKRS